ncbi:Beta-fructofuranosidase, insoluble isoenzyme like [Quillaja saponaria]|uniref:Beta-fructofuranosidase, insoluble isoenzyme like n=1 Tax=Quillaja saponaria TaxID=32244 RepID=A0AAD7LTP6_QUISA|nr:Beta-fructofuranosidase, insoluble isoenzyme like [Quillaja saponaria]
MCRDQSRSSLNKNNDRTTYGAFLVVIEMIDHSIVESFEGEGKACFSARNWRFLDTSMADYSDINSRLVERQKELLNLCTLHHKLKITSEFYPDKIKKNGVSIYVQDIDSVKQGIETKQRRDESELGGSIIWMFDTEENGVVVEEVVGKEPQIKEECTKNIKGKNVLSVTG